MPIPTICPHCAKSYNIPDKYAGKAVKCQNKDCGKLIPVAKIESPVEQPKKSSVMGFLKRTPEPESVVLAKLAAKQAANDAKRRGWAKFWFQVKMTAGLFAVAFVGLVAWGMYIGKDRPQVTYISPPSASQPIQTTQSPAVDPAKKTKPDNGEFKEGTLEKIKEAVTGKEIVHRKDGTTYERDKPKKK